MAGGRPIVPQRSAVGRQTGRLSGRLFDRPRSGPPSRRLPINISRAVHYYTHNVYCWGPWSGDRIHPIDLGDPDLGYCKNGTPNYASNFDFQAHVAAEWDPRIHAEIKRDILSLLREP